MGEEELNFLKEELKKIDTKIKTTNYSSDKRETVETQIRLWELRENIFAELKKFIYF